MLRIIDFATYLYKANLPVKYSSKLWKSKY